MDWQRRPKPREEDQCKEGHTAAGVQLRNKTPWHSNHSPAPNHRMQQLLCLIGLWSGIEVGTGTKQCA